METLQDLLKARSKMSLYEYNRRQIQEGNKYDFKSLVSDIQFLDKILSPIFGINKIRIEVQGSAELTLGVKTNKVDNPTFAYRYAQNDFAGFRREDTIQYRR